MTTINTLVSPHGGSPAPTPADYSGEGMLARAGLTFSDWAERWFPDSYVFVALAVAVVAAAAVANGASPASVAKSFGEGFWSLITYHANGDDRHFWLRSCKLVARREVD